MASTYSDRLRLELQAAGENSTTWGDKANTVFSLVDDAIAGMTTVSTTGGTYTLSTANSSADESRRAILKITGTLVSNSSIVVPDLTKKYTVWNATTGAYTCTVKTSAGTGVSVTQGEKVGVFCDGTNVEPDFSFLQSGTGAIATTLQADARRFVYAEQFDDGLSDAAMIQAAIDAVAPASPNYYVFQATRVVRLAGEYTLAADVNMKSGVTVDATGAVVNVNSGVSGFVFHDAAASVYQAQLIGWPRINLLADDADTIAVEFGHARRCYAEYEASAAADLTPDSCEALHMEVSGSENSYLNEIHVRAHEVGWAIKMLSTGAGSGIQANTIYCNAVSVGNGFNLKGANGNRFIVEDLELYQGVAQKFLQLEDNTAATTAWTGGSTDNVFDIAYIESHFVGTNGSENTWSYDPYCVGNEIILRNQTRVNIHVDHKNKLNRVFESGHFHEELPQNKGGYDPGAAAGASRSPIALGMGTMLQATAQAPYTPADSPVNLCRATEAFGGGGTWGVTLATISSLNCTGPDGVANSASTLDQTGALGFCRVSTTSSALPVEETDPWTGSVWLRVNATPRYCQIRLTVGSILISESAWVDTTWRRFFVSGFFVGVAGTPATAQISFDIRGGPFDYDTAVYNTSNGNQLQMWGAMINYGGPCAYVPNQSTGDLRADFLGGIATPGDLFAGRGLFLSGKVRTLTPRMQHIAATIPTGGSYVQGDFVWNTAPAISSGKVMLGWSRLTTGTDHVAGTDWTTVYVTTT